MTAPLSVLGDGAVRVTWTPTMADPAAPPITLLNGTTAVDLSCYLTADGLTTGADEQSVTDDRLCSTQTYEKPGRYSHSMSLMYVYQPQLPAALDNKAYATLVHLTTGFITIRWGKLYTIAYTVGDIVDVYPVQCGKQVKQPPEANATLKTAQKMFVVGAVREDRLTV